MSWDNYCTPDRTDGVNVYFGICEKNSGQVYGCRYESSVVEQQNSGKAEADKVTTLKVDPENVKQWMKEKKTNPAASLKVGNMSFMFVKDIEGGVQIYKKKDYFAAAQETKLLVIIAIADEKANGFDKGKCVKAVEYASSHLLSQNF